MQEAVGRGRGLTLNLSPRSVFVLCSFICSKIIAFESLCCVLDDGQENYEDNAAPEPARLSWLAARKLDLWVWCEKCSHHRIVAVAPLLQVFGDATLPSLSQRFKCSKCGARDIFLRPDWPRHGVVSRHDKLDD